MGALTRMGPSFLKEVSQLLKFKPNRQTRSLSTVNSAYLKKTLSNLPSSSVITMIGSLLFPRPFEVEANTVML